MCQGLLNLLLKHRKEQSRIAHVELECVVVEMRAERQFRNIHAPALVDDSGILKPLHASPVVLARRALRHGRPLELAVLLCKMNRYGIEHRLDADGIKPFGVLADVRAIIVEYAPLRLRDEFKRPFGEVRFKDLRHAARHAIVHEQPVHRVLDRRSKRATGKYRFQQSGNLLVAVSASPEEFLEVQRMHRLRLLIADAVALDALDLDAEERPAANDVKASVLRKELQRRGNLGKLLQLVKEQQRVAWRETQPWINNGNVADQTVNGEAVTDNLLEFRPFDEIDLNVFRIRRFSEMADCLRLSNLPRTL